MSNLMRRTLGAAALLAATGLAAPAVADTVGVTDDEIVIGTHQDLSGPITFWGVPAANGMRMRVDEINAEGGINGRQLRLIVEDSGYDPKKAVLAVQKMLTRDRVFAVVGGLGSPTVVASMRPVLDRDRFHLFPLAPVTQVFEPFHPRKFALFTPYTDNMRVATTYMADKGNMKLGVIYQDDAFGQTILAGVEAQAPVVGAEVVETAGYKRGATDFSSQVARLKAAGVDAIMLGTIIRETIGVAAEVRKVGWDVDLIGSTAAYAGEVATMGAAVVEGVYATGQTPIAYRGSASPEIEAWMERYVAAFDNEPSPQSFAGYMIIDLFAEAARAAGSDLNNDTMQAALESIDGYRDIFGSPPVTFGPDRRLATRANFIAQVQGGKWVTVSDLIDPDVGS